MSGFAGGFGSGFANAFNRSYAMEKQKQENTFDKMLESFERNQEYVNKAKQNDQRAVTQTKNIIEAYGLPPESFMEVYNRIKQDPQSTEEWAKRVNITAKGKVKPQGTGDAPVADTANPFEQTPSAGTSTQQPQAPTQQQQQQTQSEVAQNATSNPFEPQKPKIGGVVGRVMEIGNKKIYDGQIERMMQATGRSREEVLQILSSPTTQELPLEVVDAQQKYGDVQLDIQQKAAPMVGLSPDEVWKRKNAIVDTLKKDFEPIQDQQSNLGALYNSTARTFQIVDKNPEVLTKYVSGAAKTLANTVQEFAALGSLFTAEGYNSPGAEQAINQGISTIGGEISKREQELEQGVFAPAIKLAKEAELFEMRRAFDTYRVLGMFKQQGRDVASAEYQRTFAALAPGTNPETYKQGMRELLTDLENTSNLQINKMMGPVQSHNSDIQRMGLDTGMFGIDMQLQPFAESIKGTSVQEAYNTVMGAADNTKSEIGATAGNAGTTNAPPVLKEFLGYDPDTNEPVYRGADGKMYYGE